MRRNAIARIIIFSIVIVLLAGILFAGLGISMFKNLFSNRNTGYTTAQAAKVLFSAEEVRSLKIEWASGNIDIRTGDVKAIEVTESGYYSSQQAMVYKQVGDTVSIRFHDASIKVDLFSVISKDLTVIVPKDWNCDQLTVNAASADLKAENLTAADVGISAASGQCNFVDCTIENLDIDTASGNIHYSGVLNTLDCDAASANFVGVLSNTPRSIDMDSASGDLDLTLPEGCGFKVSMDAISGKFHSDYPTYYDGDCYVYEDLRCDIDFDGASGSVRIRKP